MQGSIVLLDKKGVYMGGEELKDLDQVDMLAHALFKIQFPHYVVW